LAILEYRFTHDTLFKMLFVRHPELLKSLVAEMLSIQADSIEEFVITNPEIQPDILGEKFCRLDINMMLDGQKIDLEVQVANEGDYLERSLYYWAREFSSALEEGGEYRKLPRTIIISIVAFEQFTCEEFHSEFQALEVKRHTPLTDRMSLHFFELPKVPRNINKDEKLKLWLTLFNAKTEEDLASIEALEVSEMKKAIGAYRTVTATDEFKQLERMRADARNREASALGHARREEREKWQGVVAEKDAEIEELKKQLGKTQLRNRDMTR